MQSEENNKNKESQQSENIDAKDLTKSPQDEAKPKDIHIDKLEYLFSRQKSLISQDISDLDKDSKLPKKIEYESNLTSTEIYKKSQKGEGERVRADREKQQVNENGENYPYFNYNYNNKEKSTTENSKQKNAPENKMKNLYQIQEPFSGYKIFMLSSALLHEVVELQRETNWKWWKTPKDPNNENIQEEVIDLWHFLIQLSIEVGLDPDKIVQKYIKKNKENMERQKQGY